MDTVLKKATPMKNYRLELLFQNGSSAVVNMEQRVKTIRFSCLAPTEVFVTARAEGDKVVWRNEDKVFGVYCCELLDAMMMD